jgi:hypothetical protein
VFTFSAADTAGKSTSKLALWVVLGVSITLIVLFIIILVVLLR